MTINTGSLFAGLPNDLPQELLEPLAQGNGFRLERIVSTGHATPQGQWYDQEDDEWVILLKGRATLSFSDDEQVLELIPGDWLHIPAHRRHRVERTDPSQPTVWLALHWTE